MSSNKRTLRFAVSTLLLAPLLGGCPDNGGTTPEEPTSNTTRSMMPPEDPTPNSGPFDEVESEPKSKTHRSSRRGSAEHMPLPSSIFPS